MRFVISTKGSTDIINITDKVNEIVEKSKIQDGICLIFSTGSTSCITTVEYEDGLINDLKKAFEKQIPANVYYEHNKRVLRNLLLLMHINYYTPLA